MRTDVKRLPIFGLGCAGGVLGLARAARLPLGAERFVFDMVPAHADP